jgi:hypothetical protein
MKAKFVNESFWKRDQFIPWLEDIIEKNPEEDWEFIVSILVNDENSHDTDIIEHLTGNGVNDDLVWQLIEHRSEFLSYGLDIQL